MSTARNYKWCCELLYGAMGDLAQNRDGAFCYRSVGNEKTAALGEYIEGNVTLSAPLIVLTRASMELTRAGAAFILENLPDGRSQRELAALAKVAA